MTEQDYSDVLEFVGRSHPSIAQAMTERLQQHPYQFDDELSHFSFAIASEHLTLQLYELFRPTPWLLLAVPDTYFGEGMMRATVRRKQFVQPRADICFHATPAANQRSVEEQGLLPGIMLQREGRNGMFADSPYYIYVSLSEEDARVWCQRFEEAEYLIYQVRCGAAGIDLFVDPCSVDLNTDSVSGYILNVNHVPPHLLGTPIRR